jgi:hypothetical protein
MHDSGELADSQRAEPTLMTAGCPAVCWLSERARPLVDGHICGVDRAAQCRSGCAVSIGLRSVDRAAQCRSGCAVSIGLRIASNGDKLSLTPYPDKVTLSMWRR